MSTPRHIYLLDMMGILLYNSAGQAVSSAATGVHVLIAGCLQHQARQYQLPCMTMKQALQTSALPTAVAHHVKLVCLLGREPTSPLV